MTLEMNERACAISFFLFNSMAPAVSLQVKENCDIDLQHTQPLNAISGRGGRVLLQITDGPDIAGQWVRDRGIGGRATDGGERGL
jgi:hypothetical protein